MRFKKNPSRLPYSDELLAQQSLTLQRPHAELLVNGLHSCIQIKKLKKITAITNIKQQKRWKLQKYRNKLLADPKKVNRPELDEDDETVIDFLRKYNEYQAKQMSQCESPSRTDLQQPSSSFYEGKSHKRTKLTKLERAMKDLECTLVHGNSLADMAKAKQVAASKRGILKTKKINLLRNYRLQKHEKQDANSAPTVCQIAGSLDEFKRKLINSVIEKDEQEESSLRKKKPRESGEEDTPISVLIRSNEMQMMKSNGLDTDEMDMEMPLEGEGDAGKEEELVDEKIRQKIQKQLNIDVTDKYNFLKQSTRTKLRPKCTPDFDMKNRFRKNRYRMAKSKKLTKNNLLSENNCGQNHFLGFDKSIKRFKDEQSTPHDDRVANSLANKSYFHWDGFTVSTKVKTTETPQCQNLTAVAFRDELSFLTYSLVRKKAQCTLNMRLQQRLELWLRMCKTRKDLQEKASDSDYHLIENETLLPEQNCDTVSELLGCDNKKVMLAVPTAGPCLYLEEHAESIAAWRDRLKRPHLEDVSRTFKHNMRTLIKQMILQKQLRCNSTYAAYDISEQNVTNLYEDEGDEQAESTTTQASEDSVSSCKTSRISYCTSGNYINFSVNLQTPVKRRMSDLIDSETTSLDSCEQLPQAHIAKIEEIFTDETSVSNDNVVEITSEASEPIVHSDARLEEILDCASRGRSESQAEVTVESQITTSYSRDLFSNKAEHNGLITSFLDYGNGQNTKRKKKRKSTKMSKASKARRQAKYNGSVKKCKIYGKQLGSRYSPDWREFSERDCKVLSRRPTISRSSESALDISGESNSNSYESMYDLVKTKTRHSVSKSIFNLENCTFPRKDGDVFYTSHIPVLALIKTKQPLPDFLYPDTFMRKHRPSLVRNSPKLSMKINKFTKLQIFVIYLKNVYFLLFKN